MLESSDFFIGLLVPELKRASHQKFVGGKSGFKRGDSVHLELVPGEWDLSFVAAGFAPWSKKIVVEGSTNIHAELVPLPGQIVNSDVRGRSLVEVRRSHSSDPWRALIDQTKDTSLLTRRLTPYTNWLPPGTYDLRITSYGFADLILKEVQIASLPEPFVVPAPTEKGRTISGTITSNARRGHDYDLFLYRLEEAGWTQQKCKRTSSFYDLPTGKYRFAFSNLSPGQYRASLDSKGEVVLAEWSLKDADIAGEELAHTFR